MSIKKKLGLSAATAVLGLSLIGGGTFAYFNDTEVTNNTFAAGTLDIGLKGVDDREEVDLSIDNMKPGDWKVHQIRIYNEGSLDINDVKLNVDYEISDANGNNNGEDFADHIFVHIMKLGSREVVADWVPLSQIENLVVAEDLKPESGRPYQTDHRQTLRVDFKFNDNGQDQNIFQGDSIDFELSFEASQKEGELR
ncbi:TasA family protein [Fredinandcohnia sp. QZ13]|uniref:TasA family protein n=1 Tax=Fredinandcohnia sp. QZ13 TaxID=3073144 RepID=UPI0028531C2D|nr:TasA family protein [Fredinandcohnia sp. QZ13]MDR4888908.1 TasA family protein [Fredinandcohnia sp. QZ13]